MPLREISIPAAMETRLQHLPTYPAIAQDRHLSIMTSDASGVLHDIYTSFELLPIQNKDATF